MNEEMNVQTTIEENVEKMIESVPDSKKSGIGKAVAIGSGIVLGLCTIVGGAIFANKRRKKNKVEESVDADEAVFDNPPEMPEEETEE